MNSFKSNLALRAENFINVTYVHILFHNRDPEELVRSAIEVG